MEDYKKFFEEAPIALLKTNIKTGEFELANKYAAKLLKCSSVEELKSLKVTDFYPAETRKSLIEKLRKERMLEKEELKLHLPDNSFMWIRGSFQISCDDQCIECSISDITELVKLRERTYSIMKLMSDKLDDKISKMEPVD